MDWIFVLPQNVYGEALTLLGHRSCDAMMKVTWGHGVGLLSERWYPDQEKRPKGFLTLTCGHTVRRQQMLYKQGRNLSLQSKSTKYHHDGLWENEFIFLKPFSLWHFAWQPRGLRQSANWCLFVFLIKELTIINVGWKRKRL